MNPSLQLMCLVVLGAAVAAVSVAGPTMDQVDRLTAALSPEQSRQESLSFLERRTIELRCLREVGYIKEAAAWRAALDMCRERSIREARK